MACSSLLILYSWHLSPPLQYPATGPALPLLTQTHHHPGRRSLLAHRPTAAPIGLDHLWAKCGHGVAGREQWRVLGARPGGKPGAKYSMLLTCALCFAFE